MDAQQIIDALQNDEKAKAEVNGLMEALVVIIENHIEVLGRQRQARTDRLEIEKETIQREADERADLLIQQKDCIREIQAKLRGERPEPIAPLMVEDRRAPAKKRRGLFSRRPDVARAT